MKISKIMAIFLVLLSFQEVFAVPAPCSQEELFSSSEYVIIGVVSRIACALTFNEVRCPEGIQRTQNCEAEISVETSLKGNYYQNDIVRFPHTRLDEKSVICIIGPVYYNLHLNEKIKFYGNTTCWNKVETICMEKSGSCQNIPCCSGLTCKDFTCVEPEQTTTTTRTITTTVTTPTPREPETDYTLIFYGIVIAGLLIAASIYFSKK